MQHDARDHGYPWTLGKGFDTSNPVSRFVDIKEVDDIHNLNMYLNVNGVRRQEGNTKDMIFNSFEIISYLSNFMTLEPNDLIMTGTPKGIRRAKIGDRLDAGLTDHNANEVVRMKFNVV